MPRHAAPRPPRNPIVRIAGIAILVCVVAVAGLGTAIAVGAWRPFKDEPSATAGSTTPGPATQASSTPADPATTPKPVAPTTPPPPAVAKFTILAAGDVLVHTPVSASARVSGGYDFNPLLAGIDEWVQGADLALCHLETPIAPEGTKPSGYPMFGAPREIVTALAEQGWDGCSLSSNHSVDRGYSGIEATIAAMRDEGLGFEGTATSEKMQRIPQRYTLEREGMTIDIAHIAAAYGLNGLSVPAGKPWSVNLIDVDEIVAQAKQAREDGADLVVVSLHFGQEYRVAPTDDQLRIAQEIADSGAVDLLIGHHAHIPQPMAKLAGGPRGDGMWVAYGLGNMLSNQDSSCCVAGTESGLLMVADVTKTEGQPAAVTDVRWQGITVDRRGKHHLFPFAGNLKSGAGTLSAAEMKARHARVADEVGDEAKEIKEAPVPTGPAPTVEKRG
ncbi:hypothetical protein GCM10010401_02130 [Rarobacter faecitabidus]|uniref:Poly-gamma-glutamate synthesis protein (Capsule biosynthesis protein) n=1 Tax=Rarobacter faecitabidus TaxID=13243 RepID=A0A542ZWC4_RARFA|nr:CapA family protein [Rarobacter faecitabidus]TQL64651.1 poly-gamma-glutamate synthesis protein (capsule biosynthesis protein) [Rarobacter faecitabidus]